MRESEKPRTATTDASTDASGGDVDASVGGPQSSPRQPAASPRDRFEQQVAARRDSAQEHVAEESLWSGGYSPKTMVGWWIAAVAITIGLFIAKFMFVQLSLIVALVIMLVMWLLIVANYLRMSMGFHYELTSQRLIHKTGVVTRRSDRIEVIDIDDVSYQQGPVQRLLGVGTITIISSDRSHPELSLLGIDKVSEVAGLIDDVRRAERRRRALHIETI